MRRTIPSLPLLASLTLARGAAAEPAAPAKTWSFDEAKIGAAPAGFSFGRTGEGKPGVWVVMSDAGAPSGGTVLAQTDTDDTDSRFPMAIADEPTLADARVSVKCKPVSGKVDQACGLVLRLKDENNYYLTRANALESNVRLYYVKDGKRKQLASVSGKVTSNAWHDLRLEAKGQRLQVIWEGKVVLTVDDNTFTAPGKVGLWTKADSVTYFDDLEVEPL